MFVLEVIGFSIMRNVTNCRYKENFIGEVALVLGQR
jgi:hypothetical protein